MYIFNARFLRIRKKKINQKIAFVFLIYTSSSAVLQSKKCIDLEIVQLQIDIYHDIHLIIRLRHAPWLFFITKKLMNAGFTTVAGKFT